jgi:hypothetical protein
MQPFKKLPIHSRLENISSRPSSEAKQPRAREEDIREKAGFGAGGSTLPANHQRLGQTFAQ